METIVGVAAIIIISIVLPSFLDAKFFNVSVSWHRITLSYFVMVLICLPLSILITNITNVWVDRTIPAIAVIVASFIARSSLPGVVLVLALSTLFFPLYVIYWISFYNNINEPLMFMLSNFDWNTGLYIVPFLLGIAAWMVAGHITNPKS